MDFHTFFIDALVLCIVLILLRYFVSFEGISRKKIYIKNATLLCNEIVINELQPLNSIGAESISIFMKRVMESDRSIFHAIDVAFMPGVFNNDANSKLHLSTGAVSEDYTQQDWFVSTINTNKPRARWSSPEMRDKPDSYYIRYNIPFYSKPMGETNIMSKKEHIGVISFTFNMYLPYYY